MKLSEGIKSNLRYIVPLILTSGIVGSLLTQLWFERNVRTEEQLRLKRELVLKQFPEYRKMQRFSELGLRITHIVFHQTFVIITDSARYRTPDNTLNVGPRHARLSEWLQTNDTTITIGEIDIVSVAYDSLLQKEWELLAISIQEKRDHIDINVYRKFRNIIEFAEERPWPTDISQKSYLDFTESVWADNQTKERWHSLILDLWKIVDKELRLM